MRRPSRDRTLCEAEFLSTTLQAQTAGESVVEGMVGGTYRTILPWMAQDTQYWSFRYILGTAYSGNTEASEISPAKSNCRQSPLPIKPQRTSYANKPKRSHSLVPDHYRRPIDPDNTQFCACELRRDVRIAADSTILRIVNLFIALSLGVHLEQLEQRIGLT